jgi:hypothetical protein
VSAAVAASESTLILLLIKTICWGIERPSPAN